MDAFAGNGRLIAGRYRLGARIGHGGMGTVWRATDELLGRQVAVKEVHLDNGMDDCDVDAERERTLREARTVAQFQHPNVIVLHDVVEQDGRPCIVMELIAGRSLAEQLAAHGPVHPREGARIGLALLGALRVAHAHGVLHRDVKPANVLMEAGTGRVLLSDFGIAQVTGGTTITDRGTFVGSPEYTAPERMAGTRTGPESDLWSLGVLLCTVLSGTSPFHRDSLGGVLHAVVADVIHPPDAARPLLPVVSGLLQRDPDRRMDAGEAERLLRAYLRTGRMPEAPPRLRPAGSDAVVTSHLWSPPPFRRLSRLPLTARPSGGRTRTVLAAVALVMAVVGAGVGTVALLVGGEHGTGDDRPPRPPATSRSVSTTTAPNRSTSPTPDLSPSASVSGPSGGTPSVPSGDEPTATPGRPVSGSPAERDGRAAAGTRSRESEAGPGAAPGAGPQAVPRHDPGLVPARAGTAPYAPAATGLRPTEQR